MTRVELQVGLALRDLDNRESGRVVVVCRLDSRYAYCRSENPPHRRVRIRRDRLARRFEPLGSMNMDDPRYWPAWFHSEVETAPPPTTGQEEE